MRIFLLPGLLLTVSCDLARWRIPCCGLIYRVQAAIAAPFLRLGTAVVVLARQRKLASLPSYTRFSGFVHCYENVTSCGSDDGEFEDTPVIGAIAEASAVC